MLSVASRQQRQIHACSLLSLHLMGSVAETKIQCCGDKNSVLWRQKFSVAETKISVANKNSQKFTTKFVKESVAKRCGVLRDFRGSVAQFLHAWKMPSEAS